MTIGRTTLFISGCIRFDTHDSRVSRYRLFGAQRFVRAMAHPPELNASVDGIAEASFSAFPRAALARACARSAPGGIRATDISLESHGSFLCIVVRSKKSFTMIAASGFARTVTCAY